MRVLYFIGVLLAGIGSSVALEIEQAYRMIPHRQTPFLLEQSNIRATEATKVSRLLSLAELAMVARVEAGNSSPRKTDYFAQIDSILWQLENLKSPENLLGAQQHIIAAIKLQRLYFELFHEEANHLQAKRNQLVHTSHRHLIDAYQLLMRVYPQETQHNKQAFFDYLCALDFI